MDDDKKPNNMNSDMGMKSMNEMNSTNSMRPMGGMKSMNSDYGMMPMMKTLKKPLSKKTLSILVILAVVILMMASAVGAYFWRDNTAVVFEQQQTNQLASNQDTIANLQSQLAAEKVNTNTSQTTTCTAVAPTAAISSNIKSSITSGNTAALSGYMASSVNVVIVGSEDNGAASTPAEAVSDITSFITSDNTSWNYNFALPTATLNSYASGTYGKYFTKISIVGKATNNKIISFSFDCNGKISTVFMINSDSTDSVL